MLASWREVDRALADLSGTLGTTARDAELKRWLDEAGAPTLDELAQMGEWSS